MNFLLRPLWKRRYVPSGSPGVPVYERRSPAHQVLMNPVFGGRIPRDRPLVVVCMLHGRALAPGRPAHGPAPTHSGSNEKEGCCRDNRNSSGRAGPWHTASSQPAIPCERGRCRMNPASGLPASVNQRSRRSAFSASFRTSCSGSPSASVRGPLAWGSPTFPRALAASSRTS